MGKTAIGLLLLAALFSCSSEADLQLNPAEWSFGGIPSYFVAKKEIKVFNRGPRSVSLRFLSTCDCLRVDQAPARLAAGQAAPVNLSYDPQGQSGFVEAALIMVVRRGRAESRFALRVYGKVLPAGNGAAH